MVYISQPTELGTIYSRRELQEISEVCRRRGLYLYMDGARLGYGLCDEGNDLDLPAIASLCDAFYIGGTKVGALFGEALVLRHDALKGGFWASSFWSCSVTAFISAWGPTRTVWP